MRAGAIAWIAGRWGAPEELALPLNDRGLLLADGLFETVLVLQGRIEIVGLAAGMLAAHPSLDRMDERRTDDIRENCHA